VRSIVRALRAHRSGNPFARRRAAPSESVGALRLVRAAACKKGFSIERCGARAARASAPCARRLRTVLGKSPLSYFQGPACGTRSASAETSNTSVDRIAAENRHSDGVTAAHALRRKLDEAVREIRFSVDSSSARRGRVTMHLITPHLNIMVKKARQLIEATCLCLRGNASLRRAVLPVVQKVGTRTTLSLRRPSPIRNDMSLILARPSTSTPS